MDPRERIGDTHEAVRVALDAQQAQIWTGLPGIIQSYQPAAQTVSVQPSVMGMVWVGDGQPGPVALPLLVDVPVQFPSGGGVTLTFPVANGDECFVEFSARCIDGWWAQGGVQPPLNSRMHDLSDAVAHLGFRSKPRALANVSTTSAQIRTDDGKTMVDVGNAGVTLTSGSVSLAVTPDGVAVTGGTLTHNGKNVGSTHNHTMVTTGSDTSGPPA